MAKRETLQQFIQNLPKMSSVINQMVMKDWSKNTLLAMSKAQTYSPKDTGELQRSARYMRAKMTDNGIVSSFIFMKPYAYRLEKGVNENGEPLHIKTGKNSKAQSGYASRGVSEQEEGFMQDLNRAVDIAWGKI